MERFWSKAEVGAKEDCWPWGASMNPNGYGWFRVDGRSQLAHRIAWRIEHGEVPAGMCILHHCDNPSCVNPDHLFVGTQRDNIRDMDKKRRRGLSKATPPVLVGNANPACKLPDESVVALRRDYRLMKRGPGGHPRWGEMRRLVEKYGIDDSRIRKIARGDRCEWEMSSSSSRKALDVVDGAGRHAGAGPHYSRRTPGSKTFTGVGQEVVLVTKAGDAVWAVVRQRTPAARGSGLSRGRRGVTSSTPYVWRNMLFRNLGPRLSSDLIRSATEETYWQWQKRYGRLPEERMRTEIKVSAVRSSNPGCCYQMAGWERGEVRRGIQFFYAPA